MKWFNDLKMAQKLVLSFLFISLFIGIVSFIGIMNMRKINVNAVSMHDNNLVSLEKIHSIKERILEIRANILLILREKNRGQVEEIEKMNQLVCDNDKDIQDFENLNPSSEEQMLYMQFKKGLNEYRINRVKIVELVKEKDYDKAEAIFPDVSEIRDRMFASLDNLLRYNLQEAGAANNVNMSTYNTALANMLSISITALCFAAVLGISISSNQKGWAILLSLLIDLGMVI